MKFLRLFGILLLVPVATFAQKPAVTKANPIRNGGFESAFREVNLWTGVGADGSLSGFRGSQNILTQAGTISSAPMPVSVTVGDLNDDGLSDIMTSDALGYVRTYLNSGTKTQPKFTVGVLTTPYLNLPFDVAEAEIAKGFGKRARAWVQRRNSVRISLANLGGKYALVVGNYFGEIFNLPQAGSAGAVSFAQPPSLAKAMISFAKPSGGDWRGNVLAPLFHDWDGDGKVDLLVGEGSYSANNIHFFPNTGSSGLPAFSIADRTVLAVGEGREQLTPAVVDVNGDGKDDLLVSDSRGRVTAYLRPPTWKKGDSMRPSGFLAKGGGLTDDESKALSLGSGINTIAVADLNGDGLFDLVVGKPGGQVAWAVNKGSKGQPKFEAPVNFTGEKPAVQTFMIPSQWDVEIGRGRGSFFSYANSVTAQDDPTADIKQGTKALKFGYFPSDGNPLASMNFPGSKTFKFATYVLNSEFFEQSSEVRLQAAPSRVSMIQQNLTLENGNAYTLSFMNKGAGVTRANVFLAWWGFKALGNDIVTRGARGASQVKFNHVNEMDSLSKDFRPSATWATFSEKFTVRFKNKDLQDQKTTHRAVLIVVFELASPNGVLYLDDFKIEVVPAN